MARGRVRRRGENRRRWWEGRREGGREGRKEMTKSFGAFLHALVASGVVSRVVPVDAARWHSLQLLLAALNHEPKRFQGGLTGAGAQADVLAGQRPRGAPLPRPRPRRIALFFRAAD